MALETYDKGRGIEDVLARLWAGTSPRLCLLASACDLPKLHVALTLTLTPLPACKSGEVTWLTPESISMHKNMRKGVFFNTRQGTMLTHV